MDKTLKITMNINEFTELIDMSYVAGWKNASDTLQLLHDSVSISQDFKKKLLDMYLEKQKNNG